jgi:hypothetical protein
VAKREKVARAPNPFDDKERPITEGANEGYTIGFDPGRINIATGSIALDGKLLKRRVSLSRKHIERQSGITSSKRRLGRYIVRLQARNAVFDCSQRALLVASPRKCQDNEQYGDNLERRLLAMPSQRRAYATKRGALNKVRHKSGLQKIFHHFIHKQINVKLLALHAGKPPIVAMGDGFQQGYCFSLNKWFRKALGPNFVMVSEFRTSLLDCVHHRVVFHPIKGIVLNVLTGKKGYEKRENGVNVFAGDGISSTTSRDGGASTNITKNFIFESTTGEVPEEFQRGTTLQVEKGSYYEYDGKKMRNSRRWDRNDRTAEFLAARAANVGADDDDDDDDG